MAESSKDKKKFTFNYNVKWFFAQLLKYIILFTGSLTSATGGFKAIPFLVSIYPFNLIAIPSLIITVLCITSALSGFIATWSGYAESMADLTNRILKKKRPEIDNYMKAQLLVKKAELYGLKKGVYEQLSRHIINYCIRHHFSAESRDNIWEKVEQIKLANEIAENKLIKILRPIKVIKNYAYYINLIVTKSLQFLSILLLCFGSLVVIGLGILSNLSFVEYAAFPPTAFFMIICIVSSLSKQLSQLSFNGIKQFEKFCELLGLSVKEKRNLAHDFQQNLQHCEDRICILERSIAKLEKINQTLGPGTRHDAATQTSNEPTSSIMSVSICRLRDIRFVESVIIPSPSSVPAQTDDLAPEIAPVQNDDTESLYRSTT